MNSKKGQDLFQHVPPQVMIDILSRLPALSIARCKCVCKAWLDSIGSDEFVNSHMHLSNPVPGLAVYKAEYGGHGNEFVELVDGVDLNCRWEIDLKVFSVPRIRLHSCANGLLYLRRETSRFEQDRTAHDIVICNPVTREYMRLPPPPRSPSIMVQEIHGFGVSRMSGMYKVVSVFIARSFVECQVYTLGLGSKWRSITSPSLGFLRCEDSAPGAFLQGNLHWLGYDSEDSPRWIHCFDLETEMFTTFSPPPTPLSYGDNKYERLIRSLSVLRDCLCACDILVCFHEMDIWLMKEYGDEKSWSKEFRIRETSLYDYTVIALCPIKVFENGDILMEDKYGGRLLYYSSNTASIGAVVFGSDIYNYESARTYASSFLSLENFAEDVFSF